MLAYVLVCFQLGNVQGMKFDNPQTAGLSKVVADAEILKHMLKIIQDKTLSKAEIEQVRTSHHTMNLGDHLSI